MIIQSTKRKPSHTGTRTPKCCWMLFDRFMMVYVPRVLQTSPMRMYFWGGPGIIPSHLPCWKCSLSAFHWFCLWVWLCFRMSSLLFKCQVRCFACAWCLWKISPWSLNGDALRVRLQDFKAFRPTAAEEHVVIICNYHNMNHIMLIGVGLNILENKLREQC